MQQSNRVNQTKSLILFLSIFFVLNIILNSADLWQGNIFKAFCLAPEIIIVLIALSFLPLPKHIATKLLLSFVSFLFLLVTLFKFCDTAVPNYFSRPFNLYIDTSYFPDLIHFLYHSLSLGLFIISSIAVVFTVLLSIIAIYYSLQHSIEKVHQNYKVFCLSIICLFIVDIFGVQVFQILSIPRVWEEVRFVDEMADYKELYSAKLKNAKKHAETLPHNLQKLEQSNVLLFFVESYGSTVFDKKEHYELISPTVEKFSSSLQKHNYHIASSFLSSPTFGGNSWLAHGTLSCGIKTFNQIIFEMLLNSDVKPLASYFSDAGYRAVSVMPGTTKPWPAGKFFGFHQKYFSWHFDYKGPMYGWSPMTDQYIINFIHDQEIEKQNQPLFIEYVLISSHAPFHLQPPYIKDWSAVGDGAIYNELDPITFPIVWPDLSNASEGYIHSISYVLKSLEDYLVNYIKDNSLIIILGDHQPHGVITGPDQSWNVPIHIISKNKKFVEPFYKHGYNNRFIPSKISNYKGMETFLYQFLIDFSEK